MIKKVIQKPILIVGEGSCEVAFLNHLKHLYIIRGCGISLAVKNGNGGGPDHVVERAIRIGQIQAYAVKIVLMDTDLPWSSGVIKKAGKKRVYLVGATPCFEGFLLKILGKPVPQTSDECKKVFKGYLGCNGTDSENYKALFTFEEIEKARANIAELDKLLNLICGKE